MLLIFVWTRFISEHLILVCYVTTGATCINTHSFSGYAIDLLPFYKMPKTMNIDARTCFSPPHPTVVWTLDIMLMQNAMIIFA